jgi:hypothetical protein
MYDCQVRVESALWRIRFVTRLLEWQNNNAQKRTNEHLAPGSGTWISFDSLLSAVPVGSRHRGENCVLCVVVKSPTSTDDKRTSGPRTLSRAYYLCKYLLCSRLHEMSTSQCTCLNSLFWCRKSHSKAKIRAFFRAIVKNINYLAWSDPNCE